MSANNNELELVSIKSQNNDAELKREEKRLEKLFYFYRDLKDHLNQQSPLQQLTSLKMENQRMIDAITEKALEDRSRFMNRLDSLWRKSISCNSSLKSE